MEGLQIFQAVQSSLVEAGFRIADLVENSGSSCNYVSGKELRMQYFSNTGKEAGVEGHSVCIKKDDQEKVYWLTVLTWKLGDSEIAKKIRLSSRMAEKTIQAKTKEFAESYKQFIKNYVEDWWCWK